MLSKTPHYPILGGELSAVPRWYINEEASFVVNNEMTSRMMLTPEEVLQIGQAHIDNQHFTSQSMQELLTELLGPEMCPPLEDPPIIVLTSENKIQGANALLSRSALDQVHQKIGDYAICPSSVHELLCLPIDKSMKPAELRDLVRSVNTSQVAPEERLSGEVFCYNGKKLELVGETFKMDAPKVAMPKIEGQSIKLGM